MSEWETFCDRSYYDLWRVRRKNERGFNDGYHIHNGEEARALVELLNGHERERDEARKEIESIKKLLLDPNAVRINMLHGKIAKLDWPTLEHINGPHPLREQLASERALANRLAEILQRIANEDYRGNRPHHCVVADCGVKAWKEARSEV